MHPPERCSSWPWAYPALRASPRKSHVERVRCSPLPWPAKMRLQPTPACRKRAAMGATTHFRPAREQQNSQRARDPTVCAPPVLAGLPRQRRTDRPGMILLHRHPHAARSPARDCLETRHLGGFAYDPFLTSSAPGIARTAAPAATGRLSWISASCFLPGSSEQSSRSGFHFL